MASEIPIKSEKSSNIIQRLLVLIVDILTFAIILITPFIFFLVYIESLHTGFISWGFERANKMPQYILGIALIKENNMGLTKCILRLFLGQLSLCFFFIGITTTMKDDKKECCIIKYSKQFQLFYKRLKN